MTSEQQYLDSLQYVLDNGTYKRDRTGTGTYSVFGTQNRYDLSEGFPLLTTKKIHVRSVIHELLWFLKGDTNTQYLTDNGVRIWDEWAVKEDVVEKETLTPFGRVEEAVRAGLWTGSIGALQAKLSSFKKVDDGHSYLDSLGVARTKDIIISKKGDLGPVYGKQWRDWVSPSGEHIDQITRVIDQLRNDPDSRRIIVSAWNVGELDQMALMPCHSFFQFYTRELDSVERHSWFIDNTPNSEYQELVSYLNKTCLSREAYEGELYSTIDKVAPERELSCQLYQRSMDKFLGEPFNIASYALLTHMIAQQVGMAVGSFVHTAGDAHIYSNHIEQVKLQLSRKPRNLPTLVIKRKPDSIFDYQFEDFEFEGYDPHPVIKGKVAV